MTYFESTKLDKSLKICTLQGSLILNPSPSPNLAISCFKASISPSLRECIFKSLRTTYEKMKVNLD